MNFLSNVWGALKTGAKSVANSLNTALQSVKGYNIASANKALDFSNSALQAGQSRNQTLVPNMTVAPNLAQGEPGGPGVNGVSQGNILFQVGREQAVNQAQSGASAQSHIRPSTATSNKKSTWTPPVDQYGRESTKQAGMPYLDAKGNYVIPDTGFSGLSGGGGSGFAASTPETGTQGVSGAGVRGFAGVGQGTASSLYGTPTSDEESRKREERIGTQTTTPSPTQQALAAMTAQGQQTPIQPPGVPETIDAGWITATQETLNKTMNSNLTEQSKQEIYSQLMNNLVSAKTRLDQVSPIPEMPVVDTQEQLAFLNQQADPFGVKQAIDQFRAEQTNLSELQTTKVELMKNVQALNEAYRPIIDEIKQNPNMPKALARRKIEALAVTQKETLQGFLDQLEIVGQQIDDQNEMVNRAFDIVSLSESRANRAQDNMRANLQLMVSSGAIGGFSDAELTQYANALGISANGLKKARDAALEPETEQSTIRDDAGNVWSVVFDNKGNKISQTKLFNAAPKSDTVGGSNAQIYLPTVQAAIAGGATPEEAILAAIAVADNFGDKISNADRRILLEAGRKASTASVTSPTQTFADPVDQFLFNPTTRTSTPATRLKGSPTTKQPVSSDKPLFTITPDLI